MRAFDVAPNRPIGWTARFRFSADSIELYMLISIESQVEHELMRKSLSRRWELFRHLTRIRMHLISARRQQLCDI